MATDGRSKMQKLAFYAALLFFQANAQAATVTDLLADSFSPILCTMDFRNTSTNLNLAWRITDQYKGLTLSKTAPIAIGQTEFLLAQSPGMLSGGEMLTVYSEKNLNGSVVRDQFKAQSFLSTEDDSILNFSVRTGWWTTEPVRMAETEGFELLASNLVNQTTNTPDSNCEKSEGVLID
jgi:hypothetical protein